MFTSLTLLNGWIVGDNGTILHTTNGGVSFVEEEQIDEVPTRVFTFTELPQSISIPCTTIKYSIPSNVKSEMVKRIKSI